MVWFKKARKPIAADPSKPSRVPEGLWVKCTGCSQVLYNKDLSQNLHVCPKCGFHFRMSATERLRTLFDGPWTEYDRGLVSIDPLRFTDTKPYASRLKASIEATGLKDAVVVASGRIDGFEVIVAAMSFGTDVSWNSDRVTALAGWNQVHFQDDGTGHNNESLLSNYLNTNTTYRFRQNRFGVVHSFNWDIRAKDILQQRIAGYYNAQCCGITAEWQNFDYSRLGSNALVAHDRRFHISVTLAGIGNVSNIFGALAGTPNR